MNLIKAYVSSRVYRKDYVILKFLGEFTKPVNRSDSKFKAIELNPAHFYVVVGCFLILKQILWYLSFLNNIELVFI